MADVHVLPGVGRPDLESRLDPKVCLREAMVDNLQDVAIVGRLTNGEIVVWGNKPDADAVLGLLARGATWLADSEQVSDPVED